MQRPASGGLGARARDATGTGNASRAQPACAGNAADATGTEGRGCRACSRSSTRPREPDWRSSCLRAGDLHGNPAPGSYSIRWRWRRGDGACRELRAVRQRDRRRRSQRCAVERRQVLQRLQRRRHQGSCGASRRRGSDDAARCARSGCTSGPHDAVEGGTVTCPVQQCADRCRDSFGNSSAPGVAGVRDGGARVGSSHTAATRADR